MDPKLTGVFDAMQIAEAARLNTAKTEGATILQQQIIQQSATIARLNNELREAKDQLEDYEYLLCKPLHEIASLNADFRKAYEEHQTMMAKWMVSQKAFKELAIQFGLEKGIDSDSVIEMGNNKKTDVLDNKNKKEHGTNADDVNTIKNRKEELRKILSK